MYYQGEIHEGKGKQLQMIFECRREKETPARMKAQNREREQPLHRKMFLGRKGVFNCVKYCKE